MSRRVLVVAIVAVLVAVTATVVIAVHQSGGGTTAIRPVDVTSADIPITVAHGGTVRLTGATLIVPPGAVSVDGRLVARTDGPQVDTSLGLNGKPGAAKPAISSAGRSVSFELRGGTLIHPATLTLSVDPAAFAQAGDIAKRSGAAWLAFYDVTAQRWSPVHSQYDPSTGAVTAQVPHLSTWNPFTWDWSALTLSLRQSLSAFGSGRAPKTDCPKVEGVTVTMTNDKDPPLIGCVTGDAASGYLVSITNNRAYSMVLTAPADAVQEPRDYAGFEEYVKSRDSVTAALGGPYLASVGTVTYRLPANGTTFQFTGAISLKTAVLDLAVALYGAGFDIGTLGYGKCVLDNVAHSGAATLSEAPKLVVECIPLVGLGMDLLEDMVGLEEDVANVWSEYDKVLDTAMKVHGEVDVGRPVDWRNTSYAMTCGGLSHPFTVQLHDGKATVPGDSGAYTRYDVSVEAITKPGDLTGDNKPETAVLLACSPQPSNFFVEDVQVFKPDGGLLAELPHAESLTPSNSPLPPQYDGSQLSISGRQLVAGMKFYAPTDSHARGPSISRTLTWHWDGHQFVTTPVTVISCQPGAPNAVVIGGVCLVTPLSYDLIHMPSGEIIGELCSMTSCPRFSIYGGSAYDGVLAGESGRPFSKDSPEGWETDGGAQFCMDAGEVTNSQLATSDSRPFGNTTAEFRQWSITCSTGATQMARAWILPSHKLLVLQPAADPRSGRDIDWMVNGATIQ